jgi:hypothetical protein
MVAVFLSMVDRTAFPTQSPSQIRSALAFSSRLESPTDSGATALCTAYSASSRETSARVLASVVTPARRAVMRPARTVASWSA